MTNHDEEHLKGVNKLFNSSYDQLRKCQHSVKWAAYATKDSDLKRILTSIDADLQTASDVLYDVMANYEPLLDDK